MMTNIDHEIEKALNNKDIIKIMNKAASKFRSQLDKDTIYSCQLYALWKSLLNYKPEKNTKFTTYLFYGVFVECLKNIKFIEKHKKICNRKLHNNINDNTNSILLEILDEARNDYEKELIIDKYSNLTIKEMATKRKSNRETVRKQLINIFSRIQKNMK